MFRFGRVLAALMLAGGLAVAGATPVDGHALLQHSDPAAGATLAGAPAMVTMTFGEAPDPRLSSAKVLDASGRNVAAGPAVAVTGSPDELQVPLPHLDEGVYTVAWRTVSTVDGHTAVGSFAFGIGVDPGAAGAASPAGVTSSPSAAPPNSIARFLLLAGLVVLFGTGFVGWLVHPRPPRSLVRLAALGLLVFALGTVGVIGFQVADAGADPLTFLGTSLGAWDVGRLATVAAAAAGVGAAARLVTRIRSGMAAVTATAAAAMLVDVLTGHAAAAGYISLQVLAQLVHLLAVGLWMGGLVALLLSVRGETGEDKAIAVRRFSRWAGVWLVALAASGAIRAVNELGTLDAVTSTDFGRLLIVKTTFFVALGTLGAVNHFWSVPAAMRTLARLRRVGRLEVGIAIATLVVTGFLVNLAPPASSAAAAPAPPQPLIAAGHDAGTSVRVRLVVTPGTAGINDFSAAVTDFDSGAPVEGTDLGLRFHLASGSGVGDSTLDLKPTKAGTFEGSGGSLSLDGIWSITAIVATPAGTVEAPMAVATRLAAQQIDVNASPGLPTIYIAHLTAGITVQAYLDPGSAGPNELHATFFDASGNELPVQTATYLAGPDGAGSIVVPRQLEPGHFVADLTAAGGPLVADIVGPAPDGSTLHAHLTLTVTP